MGTGRSRRPLIARTAPRATRRHRGRKRTADRLRASGGPGHDVTRMVFRQEGTLQRRMQAQQHAGRAPVGSQVGGDREPGAFEHAGKHRDGGGHPQTIFERDADGRREEQGAPKRTRLPGGDRVERTLAGWGCEPHFIAGPIYLMAPTDLPHPWVQ